MALITCPSPPLTNVHQVSHPTIERSHGDKQQMYCQNIQITVCFFLKTN